MLPDKVKVAPRPLMTSGVVLCRKGGDRKGARWERGKVLSSEVGGGWEGMRLRSLLDVLDLYRSLGELWSEIGWPNRGGKRVGGGSRRVEINANVSAKLLRNRSISWRALQGQSLLSLICPLPSTWKSPTPHFLLFENILNQSLILVLLVRNEIRGPTITNHISVSGHVFNMG